MVVGGVLRIGGSCFFIKVIILYDAAYTLTWLEAYSN